MCRTRNGGGATARICLVLAVSIMIMMLISPSVMASNHFSVGTREADVNVVMSGVTQAGWNLLDHTHSSGCESNYEKFYLSNLSSNITRLSISNDNSLVAESTVELRGSELIVVYGCFSPGYGGSDEWIRSGETGVTVMINTADSQTAPVTFSWVKRCETYKSAIVFFDPSTIVLFVVVITTIGWGAIRSDKPFAHGIRQVADTGAEINVYSAFFFVIFASCGLLLIFYFASAMQMLLSALISFSATTSLTLLLVSIVSTSKYLPPCCNASRQIKWFGKVFLHEFICLLISVAIVIGYFMTKHFVLNDLIGVSLVLYIMTVMIVPNLKITCLLLSLLFCYDIFWVFFSSNIFGGNVMVSAATSLDLPIKLVFPRIKASCLSPSMIGLGDLALPGLLATYCVRADRSLHNRTKYAYFFTFMIGYTIGLSSCFVVLYLFQAAQPALLYLVPGTIIPVCFVAWRRGEFSEIWDGIQNEQSMIASTDGGGVETDIEAEMEMRGPGPDSMDDVNDSPASRFTTK